MQMLFLRRLESVSGVYRLVWDNWRMRERDRKGCISMSDFTEIAHQDSCSTFSSGPLSGLGRAITTGLATFAIATCVAGNGVAHAADSAHDALVEKGKYLTTAADCESCHTAKGGVPFAGGREFKLPMGVLYAPNITPDKETGIGEYTDDEFVSAMWDGVGRGGRHLYPAFPYTSYTKLSRDDVLAIKAYLFSLKPVHAVSPPNNMRFPFSQRWLMVGWNMLNNPGRRFEPDSSRSPEWNRGAYLVEALGHCGECHTPRGWTYGLKNSRALSGETMQGWKAYNITSDPKQGIGDWSESELEAYLATGHSDGRGSASGPMAEAVSYSLSRLTHDDIHAMVVYLKAVPPIADGVGVAPAPEQAKMPDPAASANSEGGRLFAGACKSCHTLSGAGRQTNYAAIAGAATVSDPEGTNLVRILLDGSVLDIEKNGIPTVHAFMPSFGLSHTDAELAVLSNYVLGHFSGVRGTVTADQVRDARTAQ
ncbi:Membrane-bound aldehyde dehydrogenase, cytochrome c subunit [Granulibacter bethesdensis]|nr:Membrane-bound aldehyde dehydrogenase, cytochrome c subunit [Granulibacter bethesdensis]